MQKANSGDKGGKEDKFAGDKDNLMVDEIQALKKIFGRFLLQE